MILTIRNISIYNQVSNQLIIKRVIKKKNEACSYLKAIRIKVNNRFFPTWYIYIYINN